MAKTRDPTKPESRGLAAVLLRSAGRIIAYAGATAAVLVIAVAIALIASGILSF